MSGKVFWEKKLTIMTLGYRTQNWICETRLDIVNLLKTELIIKNSYLAVIGAIKITKRGYNYELKI